MCLPFSSVAGEGVYGARSARNVLVSHERDAPEIAYAAAARPCAEPEPPARPRCRPPLLMVAGGVGARPLFRVHAEKPACLPACQALPACLATARAPDVRRDQHAAGRAYAERRCHVPCSFRATVTRNRQHTLRSHGTALPQRWQGIVDTACGQQLACSSCSNEPTAARCCRTALPSPSCCWGKRDGARTARGVLISRDWDAPQAAYAAAARSSLTQRQLVRAYTARGRHATCCHA